MNENIQLEMNPSVKKQRSISTSIALFSQDIDNYSFDITFTDLELQAGDQVEVLAKLHGGKLEHKSSANLVEIGGKLIARYVFDTKLIDGEGHVFCYVYLKRGDKSADVGAFYFEVDLSELDKVGGKIAEVYDGRYEDLVAGFEIRLQEYRDSLPQAGEVRAEVDAILNQFGMDSQAKLNQYDDDAQQAIADNQTAFGMAESGRQDSYVQAEDIRNQASSQAVAEWEQGADALLETVEGNESARVDAEATRETAETDRVSSETTRKTNETTRVSNEDERKSAEVIRLASEVDRVNDENVRAEFYEGFDGRLDGLESGRVVLKNLIANGDFSNGTVGWVAIIGDLNSIDSVTTFTPTGAASRIVQDNVFTPGNKYYHAMRIKTIGSNPSIYPVSPTGPSSPAKGVGEWEMLSVIHSPTISVERIRYVYSGVVGIPIEISYIIQLDLTATFGAGNEPTKSEMDELIKITGYFEEVTPTQKQLLTWQLKLMRQNRNAIVALGGTII